jgi:hypothetical protein
VSQLRNSNDSMICELVIKMSDKNEKSKRSSRYKRIEVVDETRIKEGLVGQQKAICNIKYRMKVISQAFDLHSNHVVEHKGRI